MTWPTLAVSLALLLALIGGLVLATRTRAARRERAAEAAAGPLGQFVTVEGTRVHVLVKGAGPDLVLLHGASGNLRDFLPLIDLLAPHYRVAAFDRPGLGWSDASRHGITLAGQSRILSKAARALGMTNPVVLGQSYGGAVAMAWTLTGDLAPGALVLVSAPVMPWTGKLDLWYRATASRLGQAIAVPLAAAFVPGSHVAGIMTDVFLPDRAPQSYGAMIGVGLALRRASLRANAAQVNALHADLTALSQHYGSLTLPVELIHGDADTIVPLAVHSTALSALLPHAILTVLPGAGHMPHHSHPQVVLAAIARASERARLR